MYFIGKFCHWIWIIEIFQLKCEYYFNRYSLEGTDDIFEIPGWTTQIESTFNEIGDGQKRWIIVSVMLSVSEIDSADQIKM